MILEFKIGRRNLIVLELFTIHYYSMFLSHSLNYTDLLPCQTMPVVMSEYENQTFCIQISDLVSFTVRIKKGLVSPVWIIFYELRLVIWNSSYFCSPYTNRLFLVLRPCCRVRIFPPVPPSY